MTSPSLDALLDRISESGLLDEPVADNGIVRGRASLDAAGLEVTVNVDPELEEEDEGDSDSPDLDALIGGVTRTLAMSETQWRAVIDAIADEIGEAVADDAVAEQVDLRDDLEATSVVVFADAVLLRFTARRQFPDSRILVQLDSDLEVETVEVEEDAAELDDLADTDE
ncbi:cytochrome C5 [Microbacterium hatanonis]|uniref:Cytochrome C5 n=1 Tax=Microbacterium hatanonis TaxID=404366 RepID=A0A5C8I0Y8_9MICO|nr:cytochrome C5 [Microbacterium hatanonis]TXK12456.1 cytochrome C5 [Microbacterium hatanonis]